MSITQSHRRLAVTKQAGHHGKRRSLHDGLAGVCVSEIVEAYVVEPGLLADGVP